MSDESPTRLVQRNCPLCGHGPSVVHMTGRDSVFGFPGEFRVVTCLECGMRYTSPAVAPEEIDRFYPADYAAHAAEAGVVEDPARDSASGTLAEGGKSRRDVWDRIEQEGGNRLFDLGCGSGGYLLRMKARGWAGFGVEPSKRAADVARSAGLDVLHGEIPGVELGDRVFDVVTLLASLPCMPEPMTTLGIVRRHLRIGGRLIVSTHNTDSRAARIFGPSWQGWDLPRQYNHFTPPSLRMMLERAGFTGVQIEGRRRTSRWRHSARAMIRDGGGVGWKILVRSRNLCSLLSSVAGRGDRADEIVAIATRAE